MNSSEVLVRAQQQSGDRFAVRHYRAILVMLRSFTRCSIVSAKSCQVASRNVGVHNPRVSSAKVNPELVSDGLCLDFGNS